MRSLQLKKTYFPFLLTAIFFIVGSIGIVHHEMWRDELQAWLIARDSHSLFNLIKNVRYEGHPALWHILLYGITRFTHNPVAMKGLHLLIGTFSVFLVSCYSPFTRLQTFFIVFGYFSIYEYLAISRNYALGVLLIFLMCCLYNQRYQKPLLLLVILGLLANTSFHGWIISISVAIALAIEYSFSAKKRSLYRGNHPFLAQYNLILGGFILRRNKINGSVGASRPHYPLKVDTLLGSVFYLGSVIAAFALVRPPQDRYRGVGGLDLQPDFDHFLRAISAIWRAYLPVPQFNENFWGTNFLINRIGSDINYFSNSIVLVLVTLMVVITAAILFRLSKPSFLIYSIGTGLLFAFTYAKFLGGIRHHGHFYILLLACVWIALREKEHTKSRVQLASVESGKGANICQILFTLLLSIHFFAALWPYYAELRLPFTMNHAASQYLSQYIERNGQENLFIAGYEIPSTSAFSARLNQSLYYPQIENYGSFMIWKKENARGISDKKVLINMAKASLQQQKTGILIAEKKLNLKPFRSSEYGKKAKVSQLEAFTGAIVESETFFIYQIQPKNSP